jgi:hypothetical protein
LLRNIVLDELDQELAQRGHSSFARCDTSHLARVHCEPKVRRAGRRRARRTALARGARDAQIMSKREEYQRAMDEQLAVWTARLQALETKAGAGVTAEYRRQLEAWKTAGTAVLAKLTELEAATGDRWDLVKVELERAWTAIATLFGEPGAHPRGDGTSGPVSDPPTAAPDPAAPITKRQVTEAAGSPSRQRS